MLNERVREGAIKVTGSLVIDSLYRARRTGYNYDETWSFGRLTAVDGKTYQTYHNNAENVFIPCGPPEGPRRNAAGVFYLLKNKDTGLFYIFEYHSEGQARSR